MSINLYSTSYLVSLAVMTGWSVRLLSIPLTISPAVKIASFETSRGQILRTGWSFIKRVFYLAG